MKTIRSIAFLFSFFSGCIFLYLHIQALQGKEISDIFLPAGSIVFPLFVFGFISVFYDLKELRVHNPVANPPELLRSRPKILLILTLVMLLYAMVNFVINAPEHTVLEENGKYYEYINRQKASEVSKEEFLRRNSKMQAFFTGHMLAFFAASMLMLSRSKQTVYSKIQASRTNDTAIANEKNLNSMKEDVTLIESSPVERFAYNGKDWNFFYRGIRSAPVYLYLFTGLPLTILGIFFLPFLFAGLFLSLILVNVFILKRYHLVSLQVDPEQVSLIYYNYFKKYNVTFPRSDLGLSFEPRTIKMNRYYDLIIKQRDKILLKQSSQNKPFDYATLEDIFKKLKQ